MLTSHVFFSKGDSTGINPKERVEWADSIQTLISEGHDIEHIKQYTLNQIVAFYEAIQKKRLKDIKEELYINALASSGDSKAIKRFMDDIDGKPPEMMKIEKY